MDGPESVAVKVRPRPTTRLAVHAIPQFDYHDGSPKQQGMSLYFHQFHYIHY